MISPRPEPIGGCTHGCSGRLSCWQCIEEDSRKSHYRPLTEGDTKGNVKTPTANTQPSGPPPRPAATELGALPDSFVGKCDRHVRPAEVRDTAVLIWSGEHQAWWRFGAAGYTRVLYEAGLYERVDAERHLLGAGPEKKLRLEVPLIKHRPTAAELYPGLYRPGCTQCAGMGCGDCAIPAERRHSSEYVDDAHVMHLWRVAGLSEAFLGNGGTNTNLMKFVRLCREAAALPPAAWVRGKRPGEDWREWVPFNTRYYAELAHRAGQTDGCKSDIRYASHPRECTRSHPHELMSAECVLRTEIARLANALAHRNANAARYEWLRDGRAYLPEEQQVDGGDELDALLDKDMTLHSPVKPFWLGATCSCIASDKGYENPAICPVHGPAVVAAMEAGVVASIDDAADEPGPITDDEQAALYRHCAGTAHYQLVRRLYRDAAAYSAINTPEIHDFIVAIQREALHQRERWASDHDAGKTDADWFWLIGHLAGKALHKADKKLHHIITTAAACLNWHAHALGAHQQMRPGIGPDKQPPLPETPPTGKTP